MLSDESWVLPREKSSGAHHDGLLIESLSFSEVRWGKCWPVRRFDAPLPRFALYTCHWSISPCRLAPRRWMGEPSVWSKCRLCSLKKKSKFRHAIRILSARREVYGMSTRLINNDNAKIPSIPSLLVVSWLWNQASIQVIVLAAWSQQDRILQAALIKFLYCHSWSVDVHCCYICHF